jgi:hypothetical protein
MKYLPLIGSLAVVALVVGAYVWVKHPLDTQPSSSVGPNGIVITEDTTAAPGFAAPDTQPANDTQATGALKPPRQAPAGQTEYRNEHYRFAMFVPNDLKLQTYDEGKGAMTLTFQDVVTSQGFQIFVAPYGARQVTQEKFMQDEPSGVMRSPMQITIDGEPATSFYSTNNLLGDTAEIWFIHNGYLFEVTAPKSEASWLSGIMLTWEFL